MRTTPLSVAFVLAALLFGTSVVPAQGPSDTKQSVAGAGVTVVVTFLKERSDAPTFQVVLDTHSVNLDGYRFEEITRLRGGKGGEMAPIAVEGAKGSGHHREATILFAWPDPRPRELELVVKRVAGVPERVFRWTVQ